MVKCHFPKFYLLSFTLDLKLMLRKKEKKNYTINYGFCVKLNFPVVEN